METTSNALAYLIYLPVVLTLTWFVAHTLFKNAIIFMIDIFNTRNDLAIATNKLFELGFYLLNVGFALLIMEISTDIKSNQALIEILSQKLGGYSIYLGLMLFFNLYLLFRGRRISKQHRTQVSQPEA